MQITQAEDKAVKELEEMRKKLQEENEKH